MSFLCYRVHRVKEQLFLFSSPFNGSSPFVSPRLLLHQSSQAFLNSVYSTSLNHSPPPFPLSLRPTCQWFKDGVKLTEKSHQINNKERTVTFKSASPDDNGLYYCCAKNAAGHVCSNSNFTLNIIGAFPANSLLMFSIAPLDCLRSADKTPTVHFHESP